MPVNEIKSFEESRYESWLNNQSVPEVSNSATPVANRVIDNSPLQQTCTSLNARQVSTLPADSNVEETQEEHGPDAPASEAKKPWYKSGKNWARIGLIVAGIALMVIGFMMAPQGPAASLNFWHGAGSPLIAGAGLLTFMAGGWNL